jgi:hypothetical protein
MYKSKDHNLQIKIIQRYKISNKVNKTIWHKIIKSLMLSLSFNYTSYVGCQYSTL